MNQNYCGIYEITEQDNLNPDGSNRVVGSALIEGPTTSTQAGDVIFNALSQGKLFSSRFQLIARPIEDLPTLPDEYRGVEPAFHDGDVKVWFSLPQPYRTTRPG